MFILGSSSPHRLQMIKRIAPDLIPIILSPDVDEEVLRGEKPLEYGKRIAKMKLESVIEKVKKDGILDAVILCCDTVCSRGRLILPKAESDDDVRMCMEKLSGRNHDVTTSIAAINLKTGQVCYKSSSTKVKFKNLSKKDIDDMVKSGEGIGKAGGYTINGFAESFIIKINGSYSAIVGLPLYDVRNILISFGVL